MPSAAPEIHLSPARGRGYLRSLRVMAPHLSPLPPISPPPLTHILRFHTIRTTSPQCNRALSARIIYNSFDGNRLRERPSPWTRPLAKLNKRNWNTAYHLMPGLWCVSSWLWGRLWSLGNRGLAIGSKLSSDLKGFRSQGPVFPVSPLWPGASSRKGATRGACSQAGCSPLQSIVPEVKLRKESGLERRCRRL